MYRRISSQLKAPDHSVHPKVVTTLDHQKRALGKKGLEHQVTTCKTDICMCWGMSGGARGKEGKILKNCFNSQF